MAEEIKVPAGVYDMVTRCMEQEFPDNVAIRYVAADGKTVVEKRYREYAQDIRRMTAYLKAEVPGIKGQRIALLSRNSYEYCVASFGIILAGGVLVTLNQKKAWEELEYELGLVEPALILNDGIDYGCRAELEAAYGPKLRPMDCYRNTAPGELTNCIGHDDLMMLMFTSGTTGRSKGVMLSERNMCTSLCTYGARAENWITSRLPEGQKLPLSHMTLLPLFHMACFVCVMSYPPAGWALNLCSDIRDFYRDLGLMHSDIMASAPMLVETVYNDVKRGRVSRLNGLWDLCCSSAALDPKMLLELAQNGFVINQCYGMTETSPIISVNKVGHNHPNTVGPALPNIEVRLGEGDELQVRGPTVMKGYWNREEATKAIFTEDGWLRTGDVCTIYPDGNIRITGRIKEIIVTSTGEKVPPADLESAITSNRLFSQCMVVGDDRPFIAAVAVVNPDEFKTVCGELGLDPTKPESLQDPAFRKVALKRIKTATAGFPNYGVPRQVHCTLDAWTIDNGLLTPTLKMKRNLIRQRYTAEINALYDTLVKR